MPASTALPSTAKNRTIAIIGGGPAGAATALSLLQSGKHDVRLFNARQRSEIKIGESIPPAASPVLERLGASHFLSEKIHLACSGSVSIWGANTPGHNDFWLNPVGKGFHLDRNQFDLQLYRAAQSQGAQCFDGWRLHSVAQQASGFALQFKLEDGEEKSMDVDFVVDASGQSACFARRLGVVRNVLDEVISLCAIFPLVNGLQMSNRSFAEAVENGWWYAARLPGERVIVSLTSDANIIKEQRLINPEKWNQQLHKTQGLKEWLPPVLLQQLPELQVKAAPSAILSRVTGINWLAVGDAASSYDPLTAAGITKALMHGEQAGSAITRACREKDDRAISDYQDMVFDQFNQYVSLRHQLYLAESRYHKLPFWQRRCFLESKTDDDK